jgi:hypothetical protein
MQLHRNAPSTPDLLAAATRAVWFHRRRIAAAVACAVTAVALAAAAPLLLTIALVERHQTRRRRRLLGLIVLAAVGHAVVWLWREAWRHPLEPRGGWHACENPHCRAPISNRSRARFCSPLCRRLVRLQGKADAGDQRAASRLVWLGREAKHDLALGEVPF